MDSSTANDTFSLQGFVLNFVAAMENELYLFFLAAIIYLGFSSKSWAPLLCGKPATVSPQRKGSQPQASRADGGKTHCDGKHRRRVAPATEGCQKMSSADIAKYAKLIRESGKAGNLSAALSGFAALKRECTETNSMTSLAYNSIVDACVQCGNVSQALAFFIEAKACSLADVVTYNMIMKGHLQKGNIEDAKALFDELDERGIQANIVTYHSLIHASVQAGDWRAAWKYVADLREKGLAPTSVTCSILLKFAAEPRNKAYVPRIFSLIDEIDAPFDEVLVASVVDACIQTKRLDLLAERLKEFESKGLLTLLSSPTYGAMIKAFGQGRDVEQVWTLWRLMVQCGVRPSEITLGCVVDALVMNGSVDDAWTLVQEMWDDDSLKELLNTVIYSTILKGFAMARRMNMVTEVYDVMKSRKSQCNIITFNTLLNALARCGEVRQLAGILEDMKTADPPVEPDMITYSTLMKAYCSAGDLDMGLSLLRDMEIASVFTPDEVMYNSLLDGCAKQNRLDNALTLLSKMKSAGVAPSNYTLSIMIKLLGRGRRLTQAFAMMEELVEKQGIRPNIQVYTCLMQACFVNRQLMKAIGVHDQCVAAGCPLDEKAYVSLVSGCLQAKAPEKAAEVVRCAFGLKDHSLSPCQRAPGVDARCVEEVKSKLQAAGKDVVARKLSEDIDALKATRHRGTRAHEGEPVKNGCAAHKSAPSTSGTSAAPWRKRGESDCPTPTSCASTAAGSSSSGTGSSSDSGEGNN